MASGVIFWNSIGISCGGWWTDPDSKKYHNRQHNRKMHPTSISGKCSNESKRLCQRLGAQQKNSEALLAFAVLFFVRQHF